MIEKSAFENSDLREVCFVEYINKTLKKIIKYYFFRFATVYEVLIFTVTRGAKSRLVELWEKKT
jgi:hypothetical protein